MLKRLNKAVVPAALLFCATSTLSVVWAKPPDLPQDIRETYVPQVQPNPTLQEQLPAPQPIGKSVRDWLDQQDVRETLNAIADKFSDKLGNWLGIQPYSPDSGQTLPAGYYLRYLPHVEESQIPNTDREAELRLQYEYLHRINEDFQRHFGKSQPTPIVIYPVGYEEASRQDSGVRDNAQSTNSPCERKITLSFSSVPLYQCIADIKAMCGNVNMIIDDNAVSAAGIRMDQPLTMDLHDVSLGTALSHMLNKVGLAYVVENGSINITTPEQANSRQNPRQATAKARTVVQYDAPKAVQQLQLDFIVVHVARGSMPANSIKCTVLDDNSAFVNSLETCRAEGVVKVVAQPKVTVINGKPAMIRSGGEQAVPTLASGADNGLVAGVEFRPFGATVQCTPTVLADGKVLLEITAELSTPNPTKELSAPIAGEQDRIYGRSTQHVETTAMLGFGQTLVLKGLSNPIDLDGELWIVITPRAIKAAVQEIPAMASSNQAQDLDANAFRDHAARRFLEIGQRCESMNDLEMARNCYEEAARVSPGSHYAMTASVRLAAVLAARPMSRPVVGGFEATEEPPQVKMEIIPGKAMEPCRVEESQQMLILGERYLLGGDLANAHRCFQDSHLICPACDYGQQALQRMLQVEAIKVRQQPRSEGGFEEQAAPFGRRSPYSRQELEERDQAQTLFQLGERCRENGDLQMAYGLFQETHLISPVSYYGMKAIERMTEIENRRLPPMPTANHRSGDGQ